MLGCLGKHAVKVKPDEGHWCVVSAAGVIDCEEPMTMSTRRVGESAQDRRGGGGGGEGVMVMEEDMGLFTQ